MYISVDHIDKEEIQGWVYENYEGDKEYVEIDGHHVVKVVDSNRDEAFIYVKDIPKLITALEKAKEHFKV